MSEKEQYAHEKAATEMQRFQKGKTILEDRLQVAKLPYNNLLPETIKAIVLDDCPERDLLETVSFIKLGSTKFGIYALNDWLRWKKWTMHVDTVGGETKVRFENAENKPAVLPDHMQPCLKESLVALEHLSKLLLSRMASEGNEEMIKSLVVREDKG